MSIYRQGSNILRLPGGGGIMRVSGSSGTDPYPWYPDLDLNTIPFHNASGPWGAARPVQAPTAPTIGSDVSIDEAYFAALAPDRAVNNPPTGTRYTVTGNITGTWSFGGTITDLEIVVPSGFTCGLLTVSGTRVRVRGSTIGAHSGGLIKTLIVDSATDLIIDGVKLGANGIWWANTALNIPNDSTNRVAIVNCKARGTQMTMLNSGNHYVYAGNSFEAGVYTWGQIDFGGGGGFGSSWTVRHGLSTEPVIFFRNDIRGRRFHRMRSGIAWLYMAQNQIVDLQESAITSVVSSIPSGVSDCPFAMVDDNDIYAYEAGGGARMNVDGAMYARITNNRFRTNSVTASYLAAQEAAHEALRPTADVDYTTGNTHAAFERPASWIGAGDPSDVALDDGTIYDATRHADDLVGLAP